MSELIAQKGCMLYGKDIGALLPDAGTLTNEQFAKILVQAEGIEPYEIGTQVHLGRLEMFKSKIEQHFGDDFVSVDEIRGWTGE